MFPPRSWQEEIPPPPPSALIQADPPGPGTKEEERDVPKGRLLSQDAGASVI